MCAEWALRRNGDRNTLDGVVHVAAEIPRRLERLLRAGRVSRAAAELVLARLRLPHVPPRAPRPAPECRLADLGGRPCPAPVTRHVDRGDLRGTGPGPPDDLARPRLDDAGPRQKLGDPGRNHQRAWGDRRHGLSGLVLPTANAVRVALLVPGEGRVEDRDAREPLDARHPVPPR